jgi:hypothetical protein
MLHDQGDQIGRFFAHWVIVYRVKSLYNQLFGYFSEVKFVAKMDDTQNFHLCTYICM